MPLFTIPPEEERNLNIVREIKIIRTDGSIELHQTTERELFNKIDQLLNSQMLDSVKLPQNEIMWVDDGGYEKNLPVNHLATKLYWSVCIPGTKHQILGDVAITKGD